MQVENNIMRLKKTGTMLGVVWLVCMACSVHAEIYRYVNAEGTIVFSDKPPPTSKNSLVRAMAKQDFAPLSTQSTLRIYKFVDADGVVHLTDNPPNSRYRLIYSGASSFLPHSDYVSMEKGPKAEQIQPYIQRAALLTGVNEALLHAVIKAESAYNPGAVSPKGAVGLMQLMPGTAKRYGVSDRYDPEGNVEGGARYLRDLLDMFNDNMELAVAAYNAGENAVIKYGNQIPPYQETQYYVNRVLSLYQHFSKTP